MYEIFIDIHKAYNEMDWGCCLDILEGYGVGIMALRLIRKYWDDLVT